MGEEDGPHAWRATVPSWPAQTWDATGAGPARGRVPALPGLVVSIMVVTY
jgi:hypothetical protein